jgi:acetylornithine deacetylase/succinyl-diaminopimelate desuccinylase-like protein
MDADAILSAVDEERLVELSVDLVSTPSPTGDEAAMAERMRAVLAELGLQVTVQEVEDGRPNVLGVLEGAGGGPSLMFNGHVDTSYSGSEPWLEGIPGFRPEGFVRDGRIYGLGISNMKGALACYVAAVRALRDSGVRLRGDLMIAAVVGEIETTQWGEEASGPRFRGYAAGSRFLVAHGGVADMCILGEPTEQRIVLGHYGTIWMRLSTHGLFVHTAFTEGRLPENSIVRMREVVDAVIEWIPTWEERAAYGGKQAVVNIGAISGGFGWRVSRTPHRTDLFLDVRVPPTMPMPKARAELADLVRGLRERFPDYGVEHEIYVTAPGAEIAEDHPLVGALDESHTAVFGQPPERDTVRWFSDASALTRYGIETVNYGTSSGLPEPELGENLDVEGLVKTAGVYALAAAKVCEVAG